MTRPIDILITVGQCVLIAVSWLVILVMIFFTIRSFLAQDVLDQLVGETMWTGRWESDRVGDGGKVRMRMREQVPGEYRTVWQVEHYGVFEAGFDEVLEVRTGGAVVGRIDLGTHNGGIYDISGHVGIGEIKLYYRSASDNGMIILTPGDGAQDDVESN